MEPLFDDPDLFFGVDDLPDDPVRVVLGDDNGLYRRGLLTALEDETDLEVVAEAGPGTDLIAAVRALAPDVVVCSLSMGNAGGVETAYAITEVMPLVRVAVLTTDQDPPAKTVAAVRAGALGELDKVDALEEAARVIRGLHGGWPVLGPATWAGVAADVRAWLAPGDVVRSARERCSPRWPAARTGRPRRMSWGSGPKQPATRSATSSPAVGPPAIRTRHGPHWAPGWWLPEGPASAPVASINRGCSRSSPPRR